MTSAHIDILRAMGATRWSVFVKVIIPGSLVWVLHGMRVTVGLSLLGAFIGEFIASDAGLGHLILRSSSLYNMPLAMAGALGIVLLAVLFDLFARLLIQNTENIARWLSVPLWIRRG